MQLSFAVNSAQSLTTCPIILTASILIPALVDPTFTLAQTCDVHAKALGIDSMSSLSP